MKTKGKTWGLEPTIISTLTRKLVWPTLSISTHTNTTIRCSFQLTKNTQLLIAQVPDAHHLCPRSRKLVDVSLPESTILLDSGSRKVMKLRACFGRQQDVAGCRQRKIHAALSTTLWVDHLPAQIS